MEATHIIRPALFEAPAIQSYQSIGTKYYVSAESLLDVRIDGPSAINEVTAISMWNAIFVKQCYKGEY